MMKSRTITLAGIFTAIAIILHLLEAGIPNPFPIPGVKLGLANIVGLWAIYTLGLPLALVIVILRVCLGTLLSGSFLSFGFFMGLAGAVTSTLIMAAVIKFLPHSSAIGVSVLGAVSHNIAQLAVAAVFLNQPGIFYYLPILLFSAIPAGILTGIFTNILRKRVPAMAKTKVN